MPNQTVHSPKQTRFLARALSIPILAALFAVVLLNTRLFPPGSVPEVIGGEYLRRGLRLIAIVFGLTCLSGGLIGVVLGSLIARNTQFSSVGIQILRFAQWLPFLTWYVLILLALVPLDQQPGRYIYLWTISIPAVAFAACYHYLCRRIVSQQDWKQTISEAAMFSVFRAIYVSVVLALSAWMQSWINWPLQPVVHFFVFIALALFLLAVNWIYRSGLVDIAVSLEENLDEKLHRQNGGSFAAIGSLAVLFFVLWELLSEIGVVQVSLIEVSKAVAVLIVNADMWINIGVSLAEILSGLMFNALVTLALYATTSNSNLLGRVFVRMVPTTFVARIVLLPIWLHMLAHKSLNFIFWIPSSVVVFCFYPFIQAFWVTRDQPLFSRLLFAMETALPYAFTGMIYGEMMNATAGLGFAMVSAGAGAQTSVGLAVFLITFSLFVLLTLITRIMKRWVGHGQNQEFPMTSNNA
jgi:ABC-type nitrate/sulfonate/bicarbonate transport system permease component